MPPRKRTSIMLAHPAEPARISALGNCFFSQPKLNGVRAYSSLLNLSPILFSSTGLRKEFVRHIEAQLNKLPPYLYDGELYIHGKPWHYINSIASRTTDAHPSKLELEYHIFDIRSSDPFHKRLLILNDLQYEIEAKKLHNIKIVETQISSPQLWPDQLSEYTSSGYEGIMFRSFSSPYEFKRSKSLLKLKPTCTDIYKIISGIQGKGWCYDRLGSFLVQDKHGNQFEIGSGAYLTKQGRLDAWNLHLSGELEKCHLLVKHEYLKTAHGLPTCAVAIDIIFPEDFCKFAGHEDLSIQN